MHLLIVTLRTVSRVGMGNVLVPDVPAGIEWGQASGLWGRIGMAAIWTSAEDAALASIMARGGEYIGRCAPRTETARMRTALRGELAPAVGARWNVRDEFVSAYRAVVAVREREDSRLAQMLVTRASDGFSGTNGDNVDTRVMDIAAGGNADTWSVSAGAYDIQSNQLNTNSVSESLVFDTTMTAVAEMRHTIQIITNPAIVASFGPIARYVDASNFYLANAQNGPVVLYKRVAGTFTQLGSTGGTAVANDTVACDTDATTNISALLQGVATVGPISDSAHATGKAGLRVAAALSARGDNSLIEIAAAAASTSHNLTLLGVGG